MYFGKEVRIFLKDQAKERYVQLQLDHQKECRIILRAIERIKDLLKNNPQCGNPLSKRLIPKRFLKEGIHNVYRVELPNYSRRVYTIESSSDEIFIFILAIMTHKEYDKLFGYS